MSIENKYYFGNKEFALLWLQIVFKITVLPKS